MRELAELDWVWKETLRLPVAAFVSRRSLRQPEVAGYNLPAGTLVFLACVGMQLANLEMKLSWHKVLTSCRFSSRPTTRRGTSTRRWAASPARSR
jgi:cytochrome P450